jgi:hypothetical protein
MCTCNSGVSVPGLIRRNIVVAVQRTIGAVGIGQNEATTDSLCLTIWLRILDRVEKAAEFAGENNQPNWHRDVLEPIVANMPGPQQGEGEDTEYALLVSCVIFMAYDILVVRSDSVTELDKMFILDAISQFLKCEIGEVLRISLMIVLDAEHERLVAEKSPEDVINVVSTLKSYLVEVAEQMYPRVDSLIGSSYKLPQRLTQAAERFPLDESDDDESVSSDDGNAYEKYTDGEEWSSEVSPPSRYAHLSAGYGTTTITPPVYASDVHIRVYLKPSSSWNFPCVQSTSTERGILTIETYLGLKMRVQPGSTVSAIAELDDSMTVFGDSTTECTPLSATIVIPAGSMYLINDMVIDGSIEEQIDGWLKVETDSAELQIGNGCFHLEQRGRYLVVKNV